MGEKVKVVLDTNIWVSILVNKIVARDFLPLIEKQEITVYLTKELLVELSRALTYPKIEAILEKAEVDPVMALSGVLKSTAPVKPREPVNEIKQNSADNRVLECALAANAEYVVTGDKHLLALGEFRRIKILKAQDFLRALKS